VGILLVIRVSTKSDQAHTWALRPQPRSPPEVNVRTLDKKDRNAPALGASTIALLLFHLAAPSAGANLPKFFYRRSLSPREAMVAAGVAPR